MESRPIVILLHGLGRSDRAMKGMARALQERGFKAINLGYPSRHFDLERLRDVVIEQIEASLASVTTELPVHYVGHSMGGILIRMIADHRPDLVQGRVVMLAPPNRGSEVIDRIGDWKFFKWWMGPAAQELHTGPESRPNRLGPVPFEAGVIAGTRSSSPWFSPWLPGKDDGKVAVHSTRVDGMVDHIELPVTHTFLMNDRQVVEQTAHFLRHGRFKR